MRTPALRRGLGQEWGACVGFLAQVFLTGARPGHSEPLGLGPQCRLVPRGGLMLVAVRPR